MRAHNFQDLTGRRYHQWLVVGPYEIRIKDNGKRASYWFCKCDCGTERYVLAGHLNSGSTRNCGCELANRLRKPPGVSARNTLLLSYRHGAATRNLTWKISEDDFIRLTKGDCYYCGIEPKGEAKTQTKNGVYVYNGIDRVDNLRGYDTDNCVSCCKVCNRAKDVMTREEFLDWVRRIARRNNL
jgi:hypothetical protein